MIYSLFVPAACIAGIILAGAAAGFSVHNLIRKRYRLFSWLYIGVGAVIVIVLSRMLAGALTGFVCSRGPLLTVLIYGAIDALMVFLLVDAIRSGKKKNAS